ncbi:hypothetical protein ADT32_08770 [Xylella fastidiosa]|nr:hypothetical protein BCV75_09665 [Xylella fastidiosa]KIA58704.1 hypothetical protein RA12_03650 [Xylella fastidiosa]KXB10812.1 hypothetical protein ADT32_08770 [Xylella fastidiosa]KXB16378.1 hypothetical protein ADT31_07460 [Xylella fastidiosa]KXB17255.1 hypothetical protein ADT33_01030 [Xylella fastidiosa]
MDVLGESRRWWRGGDVFTGACSHCLAVRCGVGVSVPRCVAGVPGGIAQRAWAIASPVASGDGVGLERVLDVLPGSWM